MILFIDISILLFIIGFIVSRTILNDYKIEYIKFLCLSISLIITNIINLNFLKNLIIQLTANSFGIKADQVDNEFFYMLSFLIQFAIIYFLIILLIKYLTNRLLSQSLKSSTNKYQSIHKIFMIIFSYMRSVIILSILIFILEAFPFHIKESENKIKESKTYSLISKLSNLIIK